jgi:hypothetical protein
MLRLPPRNYTSVDMTRATVDDSHSSGGVVRFCMAAMAHSPDGQEYREIAPEQGLEAAIRWREKRFKWADGRYTGSRVARHISYYLLPGTP